jgi:hypothetical protein
LFAARGFILGLIILGLIISGVIILRLIVFAFLSLLAFTRRTGAGFDQRYPYAGQTERREAGEVEGDIRPNDRANRFPGWNFGDPDQNRLGGSATIRARDDG